MFSKYLEKLEINKVTENLATFSKTFIGKKYCTNLYPFNDKNKVIKALNETNEAVIFKYKKGNIPIYELSEEIEIYLKTLKSMFFNGMNISSLTSEYCSNIEEELGKIAIEEVEEDMEEILKHFHKLNDQLLDKMYREKAEEIMKCIPMKMEQFYEKFDRECMKVPIFKYYDPFQLFQRISCASNEDIVLIKEKLLDRANRYTKQIEPEMKNIKQFKQIVDDYIKGKESTIKIVMLKEFSKSLESILEKYKFSF